MPDGMLDRVVSDYVIVGAGSAGCVLAARLSEDPDVTVGDARGRRARHGATRSTSRPPSRRLFKSGLDWDLLGEQEPGLDGRRLYLPRGRVIGGCELDQRDDLHPRQPRSTSTSGRRAAPTAGATTTCCRTSSARRTTSAARTRSTRPAARSASSESRSMHPLVDTMLEAARAAGHERNPDFNGARQEGVGRFQLTQRNGHALQRRRRVTCTPPRAGRTSTSSPARWRCGSCSKATAPSASRSHATGAVETLRAEREVILSAGTFQSPVLLMLSGIGPADELAPFGIDRCRELPVGHNLQDHCMAQRQLPHRRAVAVRLASRRRTSSCSRRRAAGRSAPTSPRRAGSSAPAPGSPAPDVEFHFAAVALLRRGPERADRPRLRASARS